MTKKIIQSVPGNRISSVRRKKKIKQVDLASALDVSPSYLCKIERSLIEPTEKFIRACSEYLETAEDELFPDEKSSDDRNGEKNSLTAETRLWTARQARGIKQYELAREIGCSPSYLSKIEKGQKIPNEKIRKLCARILKIKESELFPE